MGETRRSFLKKSGLALASTHLGAFGISAQDLRRDYNFFPLLEKKTDQTRVVRPVSSEGFTIWDDGRGLDYAEFDSVFNDAFRENSITNYWSAVTCPEINIQELINNLVDIRQSGNYLDASIPISRSFILLGRERNENYDPTKGNAEFDTFPYGLFIRKS